MKHNTFNSIYFSWHHTNKNPCSTFWDGFELSECIQRFSFTRCHSYITFKN